VKYAKTLAGYARTATLSGSLRTAGRVAEQESHAFAILTAMCSGKLCIAQLLLKEWRSGRTDNGDA
jgi:hypothetical protein